MKKAFFSLLLLALSLLSACVQNAKLIKTLSTTTSDDVFQELPAKASIPEGYADLYILASLKTHKPGVYSFEKKPHGTADYMLLLNIDGQATHIRGDLQEEKSENPLTSDSEAGEGIRYNFRKDVRLKAGPHRIAVAIPDDDIIIVKEVTLFEGSFYFLVLEPIYGRIAGMQKPAFYSLTNFSKGMNGFRAYLNGREL